MHTPDTPKMYARQILFEESIPALGGPLFPNAATLARELIEAKLYGTKGKERSLGSYLAQIISSNSRPAPPTLRNAILAAVLSKVENMPEDDASRIVGRVEGAFARDEKVRQSSPMSAEVLFQSLLQASETSGLHFIVTARTAEDVRSERASDLTQMLLRRTGLASLAERDDDTAVQALLSKTTGLPEVSYVFNVPSESHALSWWDTIYGTLAGKAIEGQGLNYNGRRLKDALRSLNQRGILTVQAIPAEYCVTPVVVLEPHRPSAAGFVLYYHGPDEASDDRVSVARMDQWSVGFWTRYVFRPILEGNIHIDQVPYPHT